LPEQGGAKLLLPEDFDDAVGVNQHSLFVAKVDDEVIIPWGANVPRFLEVVFRAVVQADGKRAKGPAFQHSLDVFDFHGAKLASAAEPGKGEINAIDASGATA